MMDELIGTFISYEVELQNEKKNSKGKKIISFKADHDDAGGRISSNEEESDEDMALLTKKVQEIHEERRKLRRKKII